MAKEIINQKAAEVEELAAKLKDAQSAVVFEYRGLNVAQISVLRRKLHEAGVSVIVAKNNIYRRAAEASGYKGLQEVLTGPNAIAISPEDAVIAAKIIHEFAKENEALVIKSGIVDGDILDKAQVETIASLPSKDGMLSMLLSVLQAPVRNFAYGVKAIAEKNEEQA